MPPKNRRLLIATRNPHKTSEFAALFGRDFEVEDLRSHPGLPEVEETGETIDDNSLAKAWDTSEALPELLVLADDSGLEVDALEGAPGVRSARYAGPQATDAENRAHLLDELQKRGIKGKQRTARFRCVLTLAEGGEVILQTEGVVDGIIANREKGAHGFGYDSLFIPDGHCQTFAEMPAAMKDKLSHRAMAFDAMLDLIVRRG